MHFNSNKWARSDFVGDVYIEGGSKIAFIWCYISRRTKALGDSLAQIFVRKIHDWFAKILSDDSWVFLGSTLPKRIHKTSQVRIYALLPTSTGYASKRSKSSLTGFPHLGKPRWKGGPFFRDVGFPSQKQTFALKGASKMARTSWCSYVYFPCS